MLIALMLSQGVHGAFASATSMDSRAALADMYGGWGSSGHEQRHGDAPLEGCHHSSCSQSFLVKARLSPTRSNCRSAAWPAANEQNPRAIILDRDPPVPRCLA